MNDAPAHQSLPEAFRTVGIPTGGWRKTLAFFGPALLVSVGYMDPGNWGTDLKGGSQYGYTLLWVILFSNLMAQFLQVLCVRLGLVTGMDLARACRQTYKKPAAYALWLLTEIAIIATDLAEVLGSAVALNLLFGIPLTWGVVITAVDVLLLLGFMRFGFRKIEAIIGTMVATIGLCFAYQLFVSGADWGAALTAMVTPRMPNMGEALIIALGILGATVMPHNLYLHSAIVQSRKNSSDEAGLREAIKYNTWDTVLALSAAFFVNAAILILAASVFHPQGRVVEDLQEGHQLLTGALGGGAAAAFAIALLCSGQSSTITGTLAGQVVMEGFLEIRVKPWIRRLVTRLLAIIPALIVIQATGGTKTVELLVLSQVILSLQLPFAILPLVMITSSKKAMGIFANARWAQVLGYGMAIGISGLNIYMLYAVAQEHQALPLYYGVIAFALGYAGWVKFLYKGA